VITNAIVPLDKFIRIRDGHGDDIELDLTNGATITGTEYLRRVLNDVGFSGDRETGYVTLVHPEEGPVNLYRTRQASAKQRRMLEAEGARCAWPACRRPAYYLFAQYRRCRDVCGRP